MNTYFQKLIVNPYYYFGVFIDIVLGVLIYPIRYILYRKIALTSRVSFYASVKNHKGIEIAHNVNINPYVVLWPTKLKIGENSQINPGTTIYGNVQIGNNVMIAPNSMIAGGNHNFNSLIIPMRFQGSSEKGISIEDDVWIGANCVILDGVTIGKGTIVGAGSVVTKNLNPLSIYFGNPAKFVRKRDE